MIQVPDWWVWASGVYFIVSIIWSVALVCGTFMLYKKVMPVLREARLQVRRVSGQAQSIAAKASNTAELVHGKTRDLLGDAKSVGKGITKQARMVGAALSAVLVGAQIVKFVRKVF